MMCRNKMFPALTPPASSPPPPTPLSPSPPPPASSPPPLSPPPISVTSPPPTSSPPPPNNRTGPYPTVISNSYLPLTDSHLARPAGQSASVPEQIHLTHVSPSEMWAIWSTGDPCIGPYDTATACANGTSTPAFAQVRLPGGTYGPSYNGYACKSSFTHRAQACLQSRK